MKTIVTRSIARRRGSALALSLAVVSVIALLSAMMLQLSSAYWKREAAAVDQKRAFYIAEAGLAEAIHGILLGSSGLVGSEDLPARFGEGVFWTDVLADAEGIVHIDSTAMCGQARTKLSIAIEVTNASIFGLGAFGRGRVVVGAGSFIDTYDSREGPYVPPGGGVVATGGGDVGSNGEIVLEAARGVTPTEVHGNVVPGSGSAVVQGVGTIVTGETTPRAQSVDLPPIKLPEVTRTGPILQLIGAGVLPSGTYGSASLTIGPGARTTIEGPAVLVVDAVTVNALGELRIDSSQGPVEIYVRSAINTMALSTITNVTEDPRGLQLYLMPDSRGGFGAPVQLNHSGDFYGSIYAPRARIDVTSATPIYGSIVAAELHLGRGSVMHLDQSAGVLGESDMSLDFLSWQQIAAPKELMTDLRYDPVRDFAERGIALPNPADAHENIEVAVQFTDSYGNEHVYRGTEARRPSTIQTLLREIDARLVGRLPAVGTLRGWIDIDDEDRALVSIGHGRRGQ